MAHKTPIHPPKIATAFPKQIPLLKTRKAQSALFIAGIGVAACFVKKTVDIILSVVKNKINSKMATELETTKTAAHKDEEEQKSMLRQKEEAQRHKNEMEFEALRHKNKMEEMRAKESGADSSSLQEDEVPSDHKPLPLQNVGELVNSPIDESARIKYLGGSFVQNRDILLLYGPPGIGKSHLIVDCLSTITDGDSTRTIIPLKDNVNLSYQAIYYDKEPDNIEWQEKYGGRMDLNGISRVPCRDLSEKDVLNDVKAQLCCSPGVNFVFVIDPLSNFDIKRTENHPFFDEMARIQDAEIKDGRNVTFILVGHTVKDPKGKGLSDIGGSKQWGESVKTVVSFMPFGKDDGLCKLTFEKSKNGKEVTRGTSFILRSEKTPHLHFKCDEKITQGDEKNGKIFDPAPVNIGLKGKRTKRRGKLGKVTEEDAAMIFHLYEDKKVSLKYLSDGVGKKYDLKPQEVKRLIEDMRKVRAR